jgi:serine/threonine-protein kinase
VNEAESHRPEGVRAGDILAGKYRVERVLGAGGMGVVVAAHHIQLDEKVALKFLLPEALKNEEAVNRFLREARSAVRIKSEHVARVSDVGQLENGAPYMVMEYLDGTDLEAMLRQYGPMPVEQAVEFLLQACEAIAEAHALGIVHRDLKPANLFCIRRADGVLSVKVLDFGISKAMSADGTSSGGMTRTTAMVGSPLYMSPEQIQSSKSVDARTDIWSLGVILFELLAAQTPFTGEDMMALILKIATTPPASLVAIRPDVPPALEQVVNGCLEKSRDNRIQNVGDLAFALRDFAPVRAQGSVERITRTMAASGIHSSPSMPGQLSNSSASRNAPVGTISSWGRTGSQTGAQAVPRNRNMVPFVLGGVALLGGIIGGALFLTRAKSPDPGGSAAATSSSAAPPAASSASASPSAPASAVLAPPTLASSTPAAASTPPAHTDAQHASTSGGAPHGAASAAHAAASATTAPTHSAAATTKVSCDPPYYFDANGTRVFKKECL